MPDGPGTPCRLRSDVASVRTRRARARADRTLAALLFAGCVIVPLLFSLSQDDVFALPKSVALLTVGGMAVIPVAAMVMLTGVEALRRPLGAGGILLLAYVALNAAAWLLSFD